MSVLHARRVLALVSLWVLVLPSPGWSQTSLTQLATGLTQPVFATSPQGDSNRIFIVEQGIAAGSANIKVMNLSTNVVSTYMTLTGLACCSERGLLGMAFHPEFATNGHFYTYASVPGGGQNHTSVVRRYTANGDPLTSNTANVASMMPILSYLQPFSNHNGGWMGFNPNISGSDSQYLYIGFGDGGSANDPGNRAQDITNQWLGKMLRVDVNGDDFPADATRNYAIPPTNPFVTTAGDDEIWAYGLRNPWRNSFDRSNGDLWIGDVGQNVLEEIDVEYAGSPGGLNFGWRVEEGTNCFDNSQTGGNAPCGSTTFTDPIHQYSHVGGANGGFSVTGGYVYRGSVAQFQGLYFFADYVNNNFWTLDPYAINPTASVVNRNSALLPNLGSVS
ncbi:MAG TPA: PQQ-dependent sugar dehydrogenase, partial [Pirellulaceae bacterium]